MLMLIAVTFYLLLPAYLANMAPPIFGRLGLLKPLAKPIDGGRKWRGEYIFGSGKTWRGVVAAVVFGILVAGLQAWLFTYPAFEGISLVDYPTVWPVFGFLAGLGAILGDLAKSFFKRRVGIASGGAWPVFDQLDFIAGFFLFTWGLSALSWQVVAAACLLTLVLHPLTNVIAYLLKLKKVWW
ncbi:MAG: CDP-2,3-bis-(O-geranylgeranyl)-sn-glycerol synthase [Candidatus Buchananbacteria bacterium]